MFFFSFSPKTTSSARGFTLIEMLVSLSLFTIVIVIVVGTFLTIVNSNRTTTSDQAAYDSLVFALDSMTREIRTGTFYNCRSGANDAIFNSISATANQNCTGRTGNNNIHGLSVVESGGSITGVTNGRIAYFHNRNEQTIMRKVGNATPERIVSNAVRVTNAQFFVTGSERMSENPSSHEAIQPTVTIIIEAESEEGKNIRFQTTITQRLLDI